MKNVIQSFLSIIGNALEKNLKKIGKKINLNLSDEEKKKFSFLRGVYSGADIFPKGNKILSKKKEKNKFKKPIYSFKGGGHNGKGNVNKDSHYFNHPRKDVPSGRSQ